MEAASGRAALDLLDGGPPIDAMVVDVVMPELSGLAFYDELSLRAPQLASRVVFFTGSQDPKVHGPIEQRGVPVISKLDDFRLVVDAVRVALLRE